MFRILSQMLLVTTSACTWIQSSGVFVDPERATSKTWALRELDGRQIPSTRPEAATIQLAPDHTVRGSSACNRVGGEEIRWKENTEHYNGTFRRDATEATITTAMGCADAAGTMLGNRFWERMAGAATWSIEGEALTIRFGDGSSARLGPTSAPRR